MTELENEQSLERIVLRAPIGSVWFHQTYGGRYEITDHHEGAYDYENGSPLIFRISYKQLEDGKVRKAGSPYSRTASNFFQNFEKVSK